MHHGETWTDFPAFKNGFSVCPFIECTVGSTANIAKGFARAALLATWAVGDQIFIGIMGGEAQNPRFSMGHATKLVPYRVIFVYMACVVFITLLIPSNNESLLGGSGITASPFVLAIQLAGIPYVSSILNAGIMCGILAISAESIYLSSRILRTMSMQKLIPQWIAQVDRQGRPLRSLIITCLAAVVLTYINMSGEYPAIILRVRGRLTVCCSRRYRGTQLVRLDHQRVVLHQLDDRCLYLLAFPQSSRGAERHLVRGSVRLEVDLMASCSRLAHDHFHTSVDLLHL